MTETIWGKLNELDPQRLKCTRVSKRLCKSDWARTPPIDEAAEHIFPRLQGIASYVRQWRHIAGTWQPNDPALFITFAEALR